MLFLLLLLLQHHQELELTMIEKGLIDGEYLQKMKADVIDVLQPEPEQIVDMNHFLEEQQQMLREKVAKECARWADAEADDPTGRPLGISTGLSRGPSLPPPPSTPLPSPILQSPTYFGNKTNEQSGGHFRNKTNEQSGGRQIVFCDCPSVDERSPSDEPLRIFDASGPEKRDPSITERVFFQSFGQ